MTGFTRRQFVQAGFGGSALLLLAACAGDTSRSSTVLRALVPVVLAGALPPDAPSRARAITETVDAFHRAVAGLAPAVQEEIGELLTLLAFPPTRALVAGIGARWEEAAPEDIGAFLERWRHSRFELQRSGYRALTQLIQGAWYDNPMAWKVIGYPGPPAIA